MPTRWSSRCRRFRCDPKDHYIIGCNRASHDYYHWLTQSLPAIDLSLRHPSHRKLTLVLSSLQPWQVETLALLGYQDVPRLTLGSSDTFLLPSAEFSDYLGESARRHMVVRAAMATFRRLSQPVPWMRGAAEEIYVARTDAPERVAENEAELIALLERQGVRIVVPGALSVAEQIAAFRAARLVIGAHGGGMSNIVFCQSGSFVYEMLPRHYPNAAFNRLAQAAGAELLGRSVRGRRGRQSIPARLAHRPRDCRGTVGCDQAADRRHAQAGIGDGVPAAHAGGASGRGGGAIHASPARASQSRSQRRWQASRRRAACSQGSGSGVARRFSRGDGG